MDKNAMDLSEYFSMDENAMDLSEYFSMDEKAIAVHTYAHLMRVFYLKFGGFLNQINK
jgi:hypothetical protein